MRIKYLFKKVSLVIVMIVLVLHFSGCNKIENFGNSGSMLILNSIMGTDLTQNASTISFSDVLTNGSVFDDKGTIQVQGALLNPDQTTTSTAYQDIMVDQIDIEYSRADGLNVQGKDVPYSFSQKVAVKVILGKTADITFDLVQHNAKTEPPLVGLIDLGQAHVLKLEAKVTIYGVDVAGYRVKPIVGYISVWCANFADPTTTEG